MQRHARRPAALSPDVVWSEPDHPFNPAAGTRRGRAGVDEWIRVGKNAEEILELDCQRWLADDAGVAVIGHSRCRARPTGRVYESDCVHVWSIRDGRVTHFQEYFNTWGASEAYRPPSSNDAGELRPRAHTHSVLP